jgi:hypothetical protein
VYPYIGGCVNGIIISCDSGIELGPLSITIFTYLLDGTLALPLMADRDREFIDMSIS